ncbi:MAG: hypothetical protein GY784_00450 [Gammaproteobacteria bacterium]|nr:hypothetical protein [Gammaproteobacteria bacterium]
MSVKYFVISQLVSITLLFSNSWAQEQSNSESLNSASSEQTEQTSDPTHLFDEGYRQFTSGDYQNAGFNLHKYLAAARTDGKNSQWAGFFLGLSLYKQGMTHAAYDILGNLVLNRPNPEISTYILAFYERASRTQPFDSDLIIHQIINDSDYSYLDGRLLEFVSFYQGVYNWERGFIEWGNDHFKKLKKGSYYYKKYIYHQAQTKIQQDKTDEATSLIEEIINSDGIDVDLKDKALWIRARLYFEKGQYQKALEDYYSIDKPIVEQAEFLIEQAWLYYKKEEYEKALGLLYAYEAPSFSDVFSPEYYILRSLVYKNTCNFQLALNVTKDFTERYGETIKALYNREDETAQINEPLLDLIMQENTVNKHWKFIKLLEKEMQLASEISDVGLREFVMEIYRLQLDETSESFRELVSKKFPFYANRLLQFEEDMFLMRYEVGSDMFQRVNPRPEIDEADDNSDSSGDLGGKVIYTFQGEYWNDELGDYRVDLVNKCNQFQDWNIFLK